MAVVKAVGLTKVYGEYKGENATSALNGVSLEVEQGEFIGVMGPSGSGKSTLVNILSGIMMPTAGHVEVAGQEIAAMNEDELALFRRRKLGFVFQDFNLLENLTLEENVMLPMVFDHRGPEEMKQKADEIMTRFGIGEIKGRYPYAISGGQQQRVAVSRALVNDPAIVFAASYCKKVIFIKDGAIAMEIVRKGSRKEFFDHILDCQAIVGGVQNDV